MVAHQTQDAVASDAVTTDVAQFADSAVGFVQAQFSGIVMHADLQRLIHADERLLPPVFEPRHGHGGLAAERIERLTAQQAEHDLRFAFGTPAQRERGSGLASWALSQRGFPFEIMKFPIKDFGIPSETETSILIEIVEIFTRLLFTGQVVLIHCAGGIGRTGMIAALLLVDLGHTVEEAIRIIKNAGSSAETDEQKSFIYQVSSFQVAATNLK